MSETVIAEQWIYDELATDTTLMALITGVYGYVAPDTAAYPFVIFSYLNDGEDELGVGGVTLLSLLRYVIRVVDDGESFVSMETAADRIKTLLHGKFGAAPSGGTIVESIRVRPFATAEVLEGGTQIRQLGGVYQLRVQEA